MKNEIDEKGAAGLSMDEEHTYEYLKLSEDDRGLIVRFDTHLSDTFPDADNEGLASAASDNKKDASTEDDNSNERIVPQSNVKNMVHFYEGENARAMISKRTDENLNIGEDKKAQSYKEMMDGDHDLDEKLDKEARSNHKFVEYIEYYDSDDADYENDDCNDDESDSTLEDCENHDNDYGEYYNNNLVENTVDDNTDSADDNDMTHTDTITSSTSNSLRTIISVSNETNVADIAFDDEDDEDIEVDDEDDEDIAVDDEEIAVDEEISNSDDDESDTGDSDDKAEDTLEWHIMYDDDDDQGCCRWLLVAIFGKKPRRYYLAPRIPQHYIRPETPRR